MLFCTARSFHLLQFILLVVVVLLLLHKVCVLTVCSSWCRDWSVYGRSLGFLAATYSHPPRCSAVTGTFYPPSLWKFCFHWFRPLCRPSLKWYHEIFLEVKVRRRHTYRITHKVPLVWQYGSYFLQQDAIVDRRCTFFIITRGRFNCNVCSQI